MLTYHGKTNLPLLGFDLPYDFQHFAECQLATLEQVRAAGLDDYRHASIARSFVQAIHQHGIVPHPFHDRLAAALKRVPATEEDDHKDWL